MSSSSFKFQHFTIEQEQCAMKVGIDSVLLGAWTPTKGAKNILDLGCGTGLLALMMAQKSEAEIAAVEIEKKAFAQAQKNIANAPYADRITLHHKAIQTFQSDKTYELIISNPPYFESSLKARDTSRTLARHNDSLTLEELFAHSRRLLSAQGHLCLIFPFASRHRLLTSAADKGFYPSHMLMVKGKEHKAYNRLLINFSTSKSACKKESLSIYDSAGKYSPEFRKLTEDFYLPSIFR